MERVKLSNDKKCIEQVKQIMESTPGFDLVYDRGAYVLDVDVFVFPSYGKNNWRKP